MVAAASFAFVVALGGCLADRSVPDGTVFVCASDADCPPDNACLVSQAKCVPVGQLDLVAPALDGAPAIDPPLARAGTTVTVRFKATEDIVRPEVTSEIAGALQEFDVVQEGPEFVAEWIVPDGNDGVAVVIAELIDVAGNQATVTLGSVTVDVTEPALESVTVDPSPARPGAPALLTVVANEPLAADGVSLEWGLADPGFTRASAGVFAHTFTLDDPPPGDFNLVNVVLTDLAGNEAIVAAGVPFVVDGAAPSLTLAVPVTRLADGATLNATLGFGADVVEFAATLDDVTPLTCARSAAGADCSLVVDAPDDLETPGLVIARAIDAAGNASVVTQAVLLDDAVPFVENITIEPSPARPGAPVLLTIAASEPIDPNLVLNWDVDPGFVLATAGAVSHTFTLANPTAGTFLLDTITVTDLAGNTFTEGFEIPFVVDGAAPAIAIDVPITRLADGDTLNATITFNADAVSFDVTLDDTTPLDCTSVAGGAECSLVVDAPAGAETTALVIARALDRAGNIAIATAAILLDDRLPVLFAETPGIERVDSPTEFAPISVCAGSRVEIGFVSDEPIASVDVRASCAPTVDFASVGFASATTFTFAATFDVVPADGPCALIADVTDSADNSGAIVIGEVVVDCTPPDIASADLSLVEHVRSPFGSAALGVAARHVLARVSSGDDPLGADIAAAAFGDDVNDTFEARAFSGPDAADPRLGVTTRTAGGWAPIALTGADGREVWISVVDGAGNASARARVTQGSFIASMGRKVAGSTFENPNDLIAMRVFSGAFEPADRRALGAADGIGVADAVVARTAGAGSLRTIAGTTNPTSGGSGGDPVVAFDFASGLLLGSIGTALFGYDGDSWSALTTIDVELDGNPGAVITGFFDPHRDGAVLVDTAGGTWKREGVSFRKVEQLNGLNCTGGCSAAFDPARGVLVLIAGGANVFELDDTGWRRVNVVVGPDGVPGTRTGVALGYDPISGRLLLFGGQQNGFGQPLTDTWSWDGRSFDRLESATGPSPRIAPVAVTDDVAGELLLVGGSRCRFGGFNCGAFSGDRVPILETVRFDGTTWVAAGAAPPVQEGSGVTGIGETLLLAQCSFSGAGGCTDPRASLYRRESGAWTQLTPNDRTSDGSAPGLAYSGMTFDRARRQAVVAGGMRSNDAFPFAETWTFDGRDWRRRGDMPTTRVGMGLAFDDVDDRVISFGGSVDANTASTASTFAFDGTSWTTLAPATAPPTRFHPGMTTGSDGRVLLFGGGDFLKGASVLHDDLWRFDGTTWADISPATRPPPRTAPALGVDPASGDVVLLGGCDGFQFCNRFVDSWVLSGGTWSEILADPEGDGDPISPVGAPPFFANNGWEGGHVLVVDAIRNTLVALGDGQGPWEYVSATRSWRRVDRADPEGDGQTDLLLTAAGNDGLVIGFHAGGAETFSWDAGFNTRPAHVATFRFVASGVLGEAIRTSARVSWFGGGNGAGADGIELFFIDAGRVTPLATNDARANAAARLDATFAIPFIDLDEGAVRVGARPRATNGASQAELATDAVELRIDYVLTGCGEDTPAGTACGDNLICLGPARCVDATDICATEPGGTACGASQTCFGGECVDDDTLPTFQPVVGSFTFAQAEDACVARGGHLASFHSSDEVALAQAAFGSNTPSGWIGLNDQAVEATFVWTDGSPVDFTFFNVGEPNNFNNEDCIQLTANMSWNDVTCSAVLPALCRID